MRISSLYFLVILILIFSSCQSSEQASKESTDLGQVQFKLLFQDSIGFGSRGMEHHNGDIYLSGIKGNVYRISQDFSISAYFNLNNDSLDYRDLCVLNQENIIVCNSAPEAGYIFNIQKDKLDTLYINQEKGVFLDDLIMDKNGNIFCLGDPIDQKLFLLKSTDSGKTWNRILDQIEIKDGEFFFAASGTCMSVIEDSIYFAIGGSDSYILKVSMKTGEHQKLISKIPFSESSGINSMLIENGIYYLAGGDYTQKDSNAISFESISSSERLSSNIGYQSSVSKFENYIFCSGPNGIYFKKDDEKDWTKLTDTGYYKVIATDGKLFCSGGKGKFAIYSIKHE